MIIHWEPKQSVENGQSESGHVPWQQAKMGLVHKNERKIYHMHHQKEYEIAYGTHDISLNFIFILSKTSLMLGFLPKPNLSCMNWSDKFHYFGIMKKFILTYVKSRETKGYLKTRVKLKLLDGKLDF